MIMLAVFFAGLIIGGVIVGTLMRLDRMDRETAVFEEGQRSVAPSPGDLVPRRPVGEVPGWDRRHPSRHRGMSDCTVALAGLLTAAAVLWASGMFGGQ